MRRSPPGGGTGIAPAGAAVPAITAPVTSSASNVRRIMSIPSTRVYAMVIVGARGRLHNPFGPSVHVSSTVVEKALFAADRRGKGLPGGGAGQHTRPRTGHMRLSILWYRGGVSMQGSRFRYGVAALAAGAVTVGV